MKIPKLVAQIPLISILVVLATVVLPPARASAAPDIAQMESVCQAHNMAFKYDYDDTHAVCRLCPPPGPFGGSANCVDEMVDINDLSNDFDIPDTGTDAFNARGRAICYYNDNKASYVGPVTVMSLSTLTISNGSNPATDGIHCSGGRFFDLVGNPTSLYSATSPGATGADTTADFSCSGTGNNCLLFKKYIIPAINFLSIGVGVIVTGSIIASGIQYSTAGGDPQKVAAARTRIFNAAFALLAYIFLWAFLQYIVPGGIL